MPLHLMPPVRPESYSRPQLGSFCLSGHDRYGRFLRDVRDVQGSVQIGIVKNRPQAGNYLSIRLGLIRQYTPDCPKHETRCGTWTTGTCRSRISVSFVPASRPSTEAACSLIAGDIGVPVPNWMANGALLSQQPPWPKSRQNPVQRRSFAVPHRYISHTQIPLPEAILLHLVR